MSVLDADFINRLSSFEKRTTNNQKRTTNIYVIKIEIHFKQRITFNFITFLLDQKVFKKSRLTFIFYNSTFYVTIEFRHRAHAGPFAINVHWTFIERSVLFGYSAVSYLLNLYKK